MQDVMGHLDLECVLPCERKTKNFLPSKEKEVESVYNFPHKLRYQAKNVVKCSCIINNESYQSVNISHTCQINNDGNCIEEGNACVIFFFLTSWCFTCDETFFDLGSSYTLAFINSFLSI